MHYEKVKQELLVGLRANRSQTSVSRRLGYDYNQVYRWESGRVDISWVEFVKFARVCKKDVSGLLKKLFSFEGSAQNYASLLSFLLGEVKQKDVGAIVGCSQYRLRKWLRGEISPRLIDMMILFDQFKHQLTDLVVALEVVDAVPSIGVAARLKAQQLSLHTEMPFIGALLHSLELPGYLKQKYHVPGWVAKRIGISVADEEAAFKKLEATGIVRFENGIYQALPTYLHMSGDFDSFKSTRRYWLGRALDHIEEMTTPSREQLFGYLTYTCSESARSQIFERYTQFLSEVRFIVENDKEKSELIQLLNIQIFDPRGK